MTTIMHVISGLGIGGAEAMLVRLCGALQARGFSQHVVSLSGRGAKADEIEALQIPVTTLDLRAMIAAPAAMIRLGSLVRRLRPGILQGWMYHGDLFATLAHRLGPDRKSRKLLWNIRASNTHEGGYSRIVRLNATLSRLPDVVLANSRAGIDFHIAQGYRPRRSDVIPNGVEEAKFKPDAQARIQVRAELGLPSESVIAIHVARVDPMKDHQSFLDAMAMVPNLRGLVVGVGTDKLVLPPNVRALGVRKDVDRLYAASDIVVSTSVFAEGFSNVIAEGMSAGLVPVTTDIGDARLIIDDIGIVVPLRDPTTLARELKALAATPQLKARGLEARTRIEQNFTLDKVADRFAALYSER